MMQSAAAIGPVSGIYTMEDNHRPVHQILHDVITYLHPLGASADTVALAAELRSRRCVTEDWPDAAGLAHWSEDLRPTGLGPASREGPK